MTLLITVFAAVVSTIIWYSNENARRLNISVLCYMFWGASLMWFVDAIFEYMELGAEYFVPKTQDMINDGFLGLSVVAFALVIWVVIMLVKDPNDVVKNSLKKNK